MSSPFKAPIKRYYFGKIVHGAPYLHPRKFNKNILSIRKLILKTEEEIAEETKKYPYRYYRENFKNIPLVRRCKNWTVKIFGNYYFIEIGFPWAISNVELGWKDKFNTPRLEWCPALYIYFFHWQFCIWWDYPNSDNYWEMYIWWKYYCNKDLKEAEDSWVWRNATTGLSTWNKENLK